jgi:hypothetical protein
MRLPRRRKNKTPDDGATHRYVGQTTVFGLQAGARCTLQHRGGKTRGGLVGIRTADKAWKVLRTQLEAIER